MPGKLARGVSGNGPCSCSQRWTLQDTSLGLVRACPDKKKDP